MEKRPVSESEDGMNILVTGAKGMVGIACILNLMSGGWKAIRIGYIPQCVILDYCGCGHWRENRKMTNININKLIVKKDINTYKIN